MAPSTLGNPATPGGRGFPARRNRAALAPWGGEQIVGFFIEVTDAPAAGHQTAVLRACEVLSGFRGGRFAGVGGPVLDVVGPRCGAANVVPFYGPCHSQCLTQEFWRVGEDLS